jgi:putative endonuclease
MPGRGPGDRQRCRRRASKDLGLRTALEGNAIVFVEVKAGRQGTPAEAVIPEDQRPVTVAGQHFLKKHGLLDERCRFDVVAIVWPDVDVPPQIDHIRDAFEAVSRGQMIC